MGQYEQMQRVQGASAGDVLRMAEQAGHKVSPLAKMVTNPWGSMFTQMAAMSAMQPLLGRLGITDPILGGILPFMAVSALPGMTERWAGVPRYQQQLLQQARRGQLPAAAAGTKAASLATPSVAFPRVTAVLMK